MAEPSSLPDDIAALKRLLLGRDELIAKLMAEIARLKRWQFGRSAERVEETLAQLQLALDDLQGAPKGMEEAPVALPPAEESTQAHSTQRVLPFRRTPRSLPAHLLRKTVIHAPAACNCPDCGGALRKLGEDIAEMLDFVPGYFQVIRHLRHDMTNRDMTQ